MARVVRSNSLAKIADAVGGAHGSFVAGGGKGKGLASPRKVDVYVNVNYESKEKRVTKPERGSPARSTAHGRLPAR